MNIDDIVMQLCESYGEKDVLAAVKKSLLKKANSLEGNQYQSYLEWASKYVQEAIDVLLVLRSYFGIDAYVDRNFELLRKQIAMELELNEVFETYNNSNIENGVSRVEK